LVPGARLPRLFSITGQAPPAPRCSDVTGLTAGGPTGPHLPCSIEPPGPCCRVQAGRRLGLLFRHLGGTANQRGRHGIDAKDPLRAPQRR
jgi:hypothetical protein